MSDYSIRADGLGKRYRITRGKRRVMLRDTLQNALASGFDSMRLAIASNEAGPSRFSNRTFWALQDVSFNIRAGDSVGIVGSNGAGKSTLLKLLSRVTAPTTGRIRLRGRVGSLLEVGTGFHPELTGRENVFLNGAVLGMRKQEIDRKFDEIVAFSEVEEFLDTPVKFYSSGMRMRLAFSVAAHLEPEILLIDEVLSVGDAAFQRKSLSKMGDVVGHGRTVLFVSHNMAAVRALCRSAIYFKDGRIAYAGEVNQVLEAYLSQPQTHNGAAIEFEPNKNLKMQFMSVALEDQDGGLLTSAPHDLPFWARLKVAVRAPIYQSHLALHILDSDLNIILTVRDFEQNIDGLTTRAAGMYEYRIRFPASYLVPGNYWLGMEAVEKSRWRPKILDRVNAIWPFEIYDNGSLLSRVNIPWSGKVILPAEWECVDRQDLIS